MNTEEKAQAYDEALERARRIKNGEGDWRYSDLIEIGPALTEIFPDLKESEDERIIQNLIDAFTEYKKSGGIDFHGIEINTLLAWLEKQKDCFFVPKSHIDPIGEPGVDGMVILEKFKDLQLGYPGIYFYDGKKLHFQGNPAMVENHDFAMNQQEEKQKEQKPELVQQPPITYTYNSNASRDERLKAALLALLNSDLIKVAGNKFTKQDLIEWVERIPTDKPAEWSEEDEKIIQSLILEVNKYVFFAGIEANKIVSFLKSLRPQPHKEIYQAAKHDLAIRFMNYLDANRPDGKMCLSNGECEDIDKAFKENDWAKIVRYYEKYRSQWKPSEEQMAALDKAIPVCMGVVGRDEIAPLESLYEQLKSIQ